MAVHDIQASFAGGEISPSAHARVDLAKYKVSCKTLRNFIAGPHGEAYKRPGTLYVAKAKHADKASRVVSFISSTDEAYVLEFGDQYIRFYKNGSQIEDGGPYEVATPYLEADLFDLKFTQSVDTLYIAHPAYAPRTLFRNSDTNWTLGLYAFQNGPFMLANTNDERVMSVTYAGGIYTLGFSFGFSSAGYFNSGHVGALFQLNYTTAGQSVTHDFSGTGQTSSIAIGGWNGTWRLITSGTWTGAIQVEYSINGGTAWKKIQAYQSFNDTNVNTFGTIDNAGTAFLVRVNCTAYTSGTIHVTLNSDGFNDSGIVEISSITDNRHAVVAIVKDTQPSLKDQPAATFDWSEGSWSTYRGWPSTATFCQDRLAWGGTPTEPQTEWMTKTSNYVDFGRSEPLVDSDGITVNLTGRQLNPIQALINFLNAVVAFTSGSEHSTIGGNGPMAPASVETKMQGSRGCNGVQPLLIGQRILFIQPASSSVREMIYQYFTDVFESQDISRISDHLFKGYSIVDMAYQQSPDSLVWMVRSDGALLCLTYIVEQEMLAWSRHDTVGAFESICTIPGTTGDEVWLIANRNGSRFVERMLPRTTSADPADQYFVDCGIPYSGAAVSVLSGYDHLNGLTVGINAGGFVLPQRVVSGGTVNLDGSHAKAQVGLPYLADLETLNSDFPMRDGTSQGRKYQISRVTVRLLNTVGGQVGSDLDSLDDLEVAAQPPQRDPSLSGSTPTPLFSGFQTLTMPRNDDQRNHVAIRQPDPMPMTVLSILPIIDPGENP